MTVTHAGPAAELAVAMRIRPGGEGDEGDAGKGEEGEKGGQPHALVDARRATMRCAVEAERLPCRGPAVRGRRVCRMHGGTVGSGAPKGSRNGMWRGGKWSNEAVGLKRVRRVLLRLTRMALKEWRECGQHSQP